MLFTIHITLMNLRGNSIGTDDDDDDDDGRRRRTTHFKSFLLLDVVLEGVAGIPVFGRCHRIVLQGLLFLRDRNSCTYLHQIPSGSLWIPIPPRAHWLSWSGGGAQGQTRHGGPVFKKATTARARCALKTLG